MVKLDSFTAGAARFLSGITGAVSFWTGLVGGGAAGVVVVFCLSSGVLSLQAASVHGGWKPLLPPEPKTVLPQFPHKKPVPVP